MTAPLGRLARPFDPASQRRRRGCLAAAAMLGLSGCAGLGLPPPPRAVGRVPPFASASSGPGLPDGWLPQVPRPDLRRTRYEVVQDDGQSVLHAVADNSASGLRCAVDLDPRATPWLEWRWRTRQVVSGATVAVDARDDSPARLAIGFDGDLSMLSPRERLFGDLVLAITGYEMPFATLMYVWEGEAPLESVLDYARSGRIRYLVVESGPSRAGRWLAYRRNVVDDYRRAFGGVPSHVRDVGVLTDSDDLKVQYETWYGDIAFRADGPPG